MFIHSLALQKAFSNSVVGTGLKSIGSFARLTDIPKDYQPLRDRTFKREVAVLGMTFVGGLLLESLFMLVPRQYRKNPLVEFIPQAVAIYASEVISRKMTNYSQALRDSLEPQAQPLQADVFTPRLDAVEFKHRPVPATVAFASRPRLATAQQLKGFM